MSASPVIDVDGLTVTYGEFADRALGHGLELPDSFTNTHLGRIGGRGASGDE